MSRARPVKKKAAVPKRAKATKAPGRKAGRPSLFERRDDDPRRDPQRIKDIERTVFHHGRERSTIRERLNMVNSPEAYPAKVILQDIEAQRNERRVAK